MRFVEPPLQKEAGGVTAHVYELYRSRVFGDVRPKDGYEFLVVRYHTEFETNYVKKDWRYRLVDASGREIDVMETYFAGFGSTTRAFQVPEGTQFKALALGPVEFDLSRVKIGASKSK